MSLTNAPRKAGQRFIGCLEKMPLRNGTEGRDSPFIEVKHNQGVYGVTRNEQPRDNEARYRLLVENIVDYAIYMLDPDGHVASWNPGAERFKGYRAPEILGEHFSRFYTPEDQASGLPATALRTAREEGKFEHEGWRVRKDGIRFWASVIIDPVFDQDRNLVGYAKITRDLTERKRAETALNASEQQFRLLVQSVTDYAIFMLNPKGYVANWNSGAERIKGYTADEIVGAHFSRFYTAEDRAAGLPEKTLEIAIKEGRFAREGWRVRKDGSRFWASVVIDPIRTDDGTLIGFAKVTRDITERLEAERELEQTREALFQSQKMEAIGQLTGGVAHDFNNLLAAALGSLELMGKRLPANDARFHRLYHNAVAALQRGASLTQRMLAFARRQDLKADALEVRPLVDGIIELAQRSLGPGVSLHNHVPDDLPRIKADGNQVEMALLNLAMNARDAMPDGGTITVEASVAADGFVILSVSDTGIGMNEATLQRATEPFFTTKGVGKGTGLGLSMVKGLAEQSGGQFTLRSVAGRGTRAELRLPVAEVETRDCPIKQSATAAQPSSRLRVLAVDDDPLVLLNTVSMLEELGHDVTEAPGAQKAIELLSEQTFDVLVTDQAMPQMTGLQLADIARSRWPDIRTVLATGYAELPAETRIPFTKLPKPFTQADLARSIEDASQSHAARISATPPPPA